MAILQEIKDPLGGADSVVAVELVKGSTTRMKYDVTDVDGNAVDMTGWTLRVANEWFIGRVGDGPSIVSMAPAQAPLGPGAEVLLNDAAAGRLWIFWPVGAFTGTVAANERNAVPICASYVTIRNNDPEPRAVVHRALAVFRHAP